MKAEVRTDYNNNDTLILSEHPQWAREFWDGLVPLKNRVAHHPLFEEMGAGTLTLERFRRALLNFYPLVESFPKYMALNLAKCRTDRPGHEHARAWIMDNMRVEARHAAWYQDWAAGFGLPREALATVRPPAPMDAVNHYLRHVCGQASLEEGIGAANLAIEWATGEWTQYVVSGMKKYAERGDARVDRRTMAWLRAHAHYDDMHPHEAMELIKRVARDDASREAAFQATKRGLEYYLLALDDCYQPILD